MGNNIGLLAQIQGVSAHKLSKATGVPESTIRAWLKDPERSPNQDAQVRLAEYFGVTIDYLMGIEKPTSKNEGGQDPLLTELNQLLSIAPEYVKLAVRDLLKGLEKNE